MERNEREIVPGDLFGRLIAIEPDETRPRHWVCRCSCGKVTSVQTHHLLSGHTKSCGCLGRSAGARNALDLTGQRFGRLTALEPTEKRRKTSVIWRCRCDCGKIVECETEELTRGSVKSCGCLQAEQRKRNMAAAIHFVGGTCIEKIACQREISTNRSGRRGVSQRSNGTWRASMDFRGKRYNLGTFPTFEEAVAARAEGEKMYRDFLEDYYAERRSSQEETGNQSAQADGNTRR